MTSDLDRLRAGTELAIDAIETIRERLLGCGAAWSVGPESGSLRMGPCAEWLRRARDFVAAAGGDPLGSLQGAFLEADRAWQAIDRWLDSQRSGQPSGAALAVLRDLEGRRREASRLLEDLRPRLDDSGVAALRALAVRVESAGEAGSIADSPHPVVDFCGTLLEEAARRGATDIHLMPGDGDALLEFRVAGTLRPVLSLSAHVARMLTIRLKIIGVLDIANRKTPQDGFVPPGREGGLEGTSLAVRTMPMDGGERVHVRLDASHPSPRDLESAGFSKAQARRYRELWARRGGIILHCGPAHSGRRSAAMAAAAELSRGGRTAHAALLCPPSGPTPVPASVLAPGIGGDGAAALRALRLRDIDVLVVDDLHDGQVARLACRAALEGRWVLGTLHVTGAVGGVSRLLEMGIEPYLAAGALAGGVGHALVRKLCGECRRERRAAAAELRRLGARGGAGRLWAAGGCARCFHTGYAGMLPLIEVVGVGPKLRAAILAGSPLEKLERAAGWTGLTGLAAAAGQAALAGTIAPEDAWGIS